MAKEVYAKAESRTSTPQHLVKLGFAVMDDTGDGEYGARILARAEEKMANAKELVDTACALTDSDNGRRLAAG